MYIFPIRRETIIYLHRTRFPNSISFQFLPLDCLIYFVRLNYNVNLFAYAQLCMKNLKRWCPIRFQSEFGQPTSNGKTYGFLYHHILISRFLKNMIGDELKTNHWNLYKFVFDSWENVNYTVEKLWLGTFASRNNSSCKTNMQLQSTKYVSNCPL